jgi:hypothetical protein
MTQDKTGQVLSFGESIEITSKPGTYKGIRYQRMHIGPDIWITVHEDGRIGIGSYTRAFALTFMMRSKGGSSALISTQPLTNAELSEELPPHEAQPST